MPRSSFRCDRLASSRSNPAAARLSRFSVSSSAPAMQPTPQQNTLADLWADFTARHHIRDGDATARLERAKRFTQRLVFIREKINDAVGNNHVDQLPGKGMFSISPFRDSTFSMTDLRLFGSESEHLVGHCQGAGFAH